MDPEEQTPQEEQQENNEPEEQGPASSDSGTFPGRSTERAKQAYNAYNAPKRIKKSVKNLKKGVKKGAQTARKVVQTAQKTIQAARAAVQAAQAAYAAASATISALGIGWEVIVIIILIVGPIVWILDQTGVIDILGASTYSNQPITVSGPIWAKTGDRLDYTINVDSSDTAKNIIITEQIPDGTQYLDAPQATYDPITNTVTWNINQTPNTDTTLSLTLLATKDNNYIVNALQGTIQNAVLGANNSILIDPQLIAPSSLNETVSPIAYPLSTNFKSCVVTKVGEPLIIPSLPPECTDF